MTDDMGFDLKLPAVGELTPPQWQDWLVRYNAVLTERDARIEKLEAALLEIRNWNVAYYWNDAGPLASHMQSLARKALEGKDGKA
jgi:hypothetical protein